MQANDYQLKALRTANTTDKNDLLLNGVLGLAGETGEVADIIKKWKFQGHELDREKLIDELSDVCWYIAITCEALDVTLEDVMRHNITKLEKRYPNGFDADRSIHREGIQKGDKS